MKNKMSQKEMIIKYIKDFGNITAYDAFVDLGVTQLAARIKELKEQGYYFKYQWCEDVNRYGNTVQYKRYMFEEEKEHENTILN